VDIDWSVAGATSDADLVDIDWSVAGATSDADLVDIEWSVAGAKTTETDLQAKCVGSSWK